MGNIIAIAIMGLVIAGQWILIWQLLNRLLILSRVPTLTPVRTSPPTEEPAPVVKKRAFSVQVND
jgi:hypothetical protein